MSDERKKELAKYKRAKRRLDKILFEEPEEYYFTPEKARKNRKYFEVYKRARKRYVEAKI